MVFDQTVVSKSSSVLSECLLELIYRDPLFDFTISGLVAKLPCIIKVKKQSYSTSLIQSLVLTFSVCR